MKKRRWGLPVRPSRRGRAAALDRVGDATQPFDDPIALEPVVDLLATLLAVHDPGVAKDPQMVRHRGPADLGDAGCDLIWSPAPSSSVRYHLPDVSPCDIAAQFTIVPLPVTGQGIRPCVEAWATVYRGNSARAPEMRGNMDKLDILNRFAFYGRAPAALQARIAAAAEPLSVAAGADLFREGDKCRELAFVGRGSVRVFKTGETGREITLYHVEDGQSCLVNMLSVLVRKPAVATARSEVPTEAVIIPGAAMREWVKTSDAMRAYAIETMAERLIDVMTLFEEVAFGKMETRLAAFLLHRFGSGPSVSATHEEIAAELGTAREVVTRLLKEFARTGAIEVGRGRLELRDEAALRERI